MATQPDARSTSMPSTNAVPIQYRQGDLLFVQQERLPDGANLTPRPGDVIFAGETTGHAHRLQAGTILSTPDGQVWLEVPVPTEVVHEEHGPIPLEAGVWMVVRQREYTPAGIRTVED